MNLLLSAPKGHELSEYVYSLPFNLYGKAKKVDGTLSVTKNEIIVYIDGEEIDRFGFSDYEEYACEQLVGCSMMVGRVDDRSQKCICAFTQDSFIAFAELCKIINHFLTTGHLVEESTIDEPKSPIAPRR